MGDASGEARRGTPEPEGIMDVAMLGVPILLQLLRRCSHGLTVIIKPYGRPEEKSGLRELRDELLFAARGKNFKNFPGNGDAGLALMT
jgi:hypothetical protein